MVDLGVSHVTLSVALIGVIWLLFRLHAAVVAGPRRLRSALIRQGLRGPPPTFLLGNLLEMKRERNAAVARFAAAASGPPTSHNCEAAILPFFDKWRKEYGDVFMFSIGTKQIVLVTQQEMVREVSTCTSLSLGKPLYQAKERGSLLGQGILTSNGSFWAHQRKILAPELYMEKVKGMINLVQDSVLDLLNSWLSQIWHAPTKGNREIWALEREIKILILSAVKQRKESAVGGQDLLQALLEGAESADLLSQEAVDAFILDNCKNIYLAGYETTAVSAIWCLMLLASHPQWQDRARAEVLDICHGQVPDADMIRKMKLLTMVINESLRLYPPVSIVSREALKDMAFGGIKFPQGVNIWTLATTLHTDPTNWGSDSYHFNPERFANGITGACKFPHLYMPFGVGPRVCLGQHLAVVELKILLSLILSRFSFTLSPDYVHSPALNLVVEPHHGVSLVMKLV